MFYWSTKTWVFPKTISSLRGAISSAAPLLAVLWSMNPKAKGEISEAAVLARLVDQGYPVSIPFGNNQRYDFIVETGKALVRVQCKTGKACDDGILFKACSTNGFTGVDTGYSGQADVFVVYVPTTRKFYWVPVEDVKAIRVKLRTKPPKKDSSTAGYRWAKDYEF